MERGEAGQDGAGRRALVTGATSGLGRAMAVELGRRGWRVALTGRRKERLSSAAAAVRSAQAQRRSNQGPGIPVRDHDCLELHGSVTEPETVKRHYAAIKEAWGGLDWSILNAGVGDSLSARAFSAENLRWTFETNVFGAGNWLEAVIPDMVSAGQGTIAGIASLAAYRGLPETGAYSASKAALATLLESVRVDLAGTGVKVVTVSPGFVKSEITDRNDPEDMVFLLETEDGARRIIEGIERGDRLVHFPWQLSWPVVHLAPALPSALYDWLVSRLKPRKKRPYVDESRTRR
ncbi:MAG: SDR family NAD(P)-dependent oxidoreductase [Elusimicrobiota bacterium]|jgi:NAD(P)-dependent dehydrogenase (short-subunit alcohol dehydrogenase family)